MIDIMNGLTFLYVSITQKYGSFKSGSTLSNDKVYVTYCVTTLLRLSRNSDYDILTGQKYYEIENIEIHEYFDDARGYHDHRCQNIYDINPGCITKDYRPSVKIEGQSVTYVFDFY